MFMGKILDSIVSLFYVKPEPQEPPAQRRPQYGRSPELGAGDPRLSRSSGGIYGTDPVAAGDYGPDSSSISPYAKNPEDPSPFAGTVRIPRLSELPKQPEISSFPMMKMKEEVVSAPTPKQKVVKPVCDVEGLPDIDMASFDPLSDDDSFFDPTSPAPVAAERPPRASGAAPEPQSLDDIAASVSSGDLVMESAHAAPQPSVESPAPASSEGGSLAGSSAPVQPDASALAASALAGGVLAASAVAAVGKSSGQSAPESVPESAAESAATESVPVSAAESATESTAESAAVSEKPVKKGSFDTSKLPGLPDSVVKALEESRKQSEPQATARPEVKVLTAEELKIEEPELTLTYISKPEDSGAGETVEPAPSGPSAMENESFASRGSFDDGMMSEEFRGVSEMDEDSGFGFDEIQTGGLFEQESSPEAPDAAPRTVPSSEAGVPSPSSVSEPSPAAVAAERPVSVPEDAAEPESAGAPPSEASLIRRPDPSLLANVEESVASDSVMEPSESGGSDDGEEGDEESLDQTEEQEPHETIVKVPDGIDVEKLIEMRLKMNFDFDKIVPQGAEWMSFPDLFKKAGVPRLKSGISLDEIINFVRMRKYENLTFEQKQAVIMAYLKKKGVSVRALLEDAVRKDKVIDTYEVFLNERISRRRMKFETEIEVLERKIEMRKKAIVEDAESLKKWNGSKLALENAMRDACAYLGNADKMTVGLVSEGFEGRVQEVD